MFKAKILNLICLLSMVVASSLLSGMAHADDSLPRACGMLALDDSNEKMIVSDDNFTFVLQNVEFANPSAHTPEEDAKFAKQDLIYQSLRVGQRYCVSGEMGGYEQTVVPNFNFRSYTATPQN